MRHHQQALANWLQPVQLISIALWGDDENRSRLLRRNDKLNKRSAQDKIREICELICQVAYRMDVVVVVVVVEAHNATNQAVVVVDVVDVVVVD